MRSDGPYMVICQRCNEAVDHVCGNTPLKTALRELLQLKLGVPTLPFDRSNPHWTAGDASQPFYSEAYLYTAFGKTEGRAVLSTIRNLIRALGLDPLTLEKKL